MRKLLKENRYILLPYSVALVICLILLFIYSKAEIHIWLNKANSPFFDQFFKYSTFLGDGAMIAILFIALLYVKYRYAFAFLTGSLVTSAVVNILKRLIFTEMYRPVKYFEMHESFQLHLVEGVKMHSLHSFPSGHTATAFNVFFMLALLTKNKMLKFVFFVSAALVGYSRVYLSQHFLMDITAGSVLGIMLLIPFYLWFGNMRKTWLDKSLIRRNE